MAKITEGMIKLIIENIGGKDNILVFENCMTRLRVSLKDNSLMKLDELKDIEGVLGVVLSNDQVQIVLGPGKAGDGVELMSKVLNRDGTNTSDSEKDLKTISKEFKSNLKAKQVNPFQKFLAKFALIFTPLISGFIAAGLLLGFATLIEQIFITGHDNVNTNLIQLVGYLKIFSKGMFGFMAILIGYNAANVFGGSGVVGAILASLFVLKYSPDAKGIYSGITSFFSFQIDPRGNIIGVLIAAITGAWVERKVRKLIPSNLDMILTTTITLLIMSVFTFLIIMPFGFLLFNGMTWLFSNLSQNPFGAAMLAGLFLISVMFGIHQGFVPVYFGLVKKYGFNSLFPILAMAGAGQVGASIALYVKSKKNSKIRKQISGAIIPGFLGIGEPLIYGVTLPRVKPFITASLGGAVGGFFIGMMSFLGFPFGLNSVFGPSGLVALPLMTSNNGILPAIAFYFIGLVISYIAGFVITYFFGTKDIDLS